MSVRAAFWDSSALVPLCTTQQTSGAIESLAQRFTRVVWWATRVEIDSAIARLFRLGELDASRRKNAVDRLLTLASGWREIQPSREVRDQASSLVYKYPLRAADSLQLAAALAWCKVQPAGRTFICSDTRLSDAAAQAGFTVLQP